MQKKKTNQQPTPKQKNYPHNPVEPDYQLIFLKLVILLASIFISYSYFKHSFTEVLSTCSPHPFQTQTNFCLLRQYLLLL